MLTFVTKNLPLDSSSWLGTAADPWKKQKQIHYVWDDDLNSAVFVDDMK